MARPVVGIHTTVAAASWGPWVDRPSALGPAALGAAVQRAVAEGHPEVAPVHLLLALLDQPEGIATSLLQAVGADGGIVVLLVPDPEPEGVELLGTLDALIVFDDAEQLAALLRAAGRLAVAVVVLDAARLTPDSTVEDYEREIAGLFAAR